MLVDADEGVDLVHAVGGGIEFLAADVAGAVDDLALQVGEVDHVEIHQANAANAGSGEIEAQRRTEAAGSD